MGKSRQNPQWTAMRKDGDGSVWETFTPELRHPRDQAVAALTTRGGETRKVSGPFIQLLTGNKGPRLSLPLSEIQLHQPVIGKDPHNALCRDPFRRQATPCQRGDKHPLRTRYSQFPGKAGGERFPAFGQRHIGLPVARSGGHADGRMAGKNAERSLPHFPPQKRENGISK
ncbi:hypothetical protein AA0472_1318 [Acetobacter estunensis NRIC 0472]|nr:hypothetical protein AA0472_1318 [Acetobacter estunensis NRIC 0472]